MWLCSPGSYLSAQTEPRFLTYMVMAGERGAPLPHCATLADTIHLKGGFNDYCG